MYSFLLRIFSIERSEAGLSTLLFVVATLLGIFLSSFDIGTHAIFLDNFEKQDLANGYLASGVLGIVVFFIYAQTFKRLSAKVFHLINSIIILTLTGTYFYFLYFESNIYSAFLGLVIMFPVNLLATLNFWRYTRQLLHANQSKRLHPFYELGFLMGAMGGGFLILFLLRSYDYFVILLMTLSSFLFMFLLQFVINRVHKAAKVFNHKKEKYVPVKRAFLLMFSTRYTTNLFFFAMLSSTIGFLIHYGFISLTRQSFPNIIGMAKFYGFFLGILFLLILIVNRFLLRRILYSYDSPYSLSLMPVGIFLMLMGTFLGGLLFRRMEALDRFTFLFILIGMNKMLYEITHYLLQVPSMRTLYRTLDIRFLQAILPRIEGSVVMLGMILAGGIIIGILNLQFSPIYGVLIAAAILTPFWLIFTVKLIKGYRKALQDTYKKLRVSARATFHTSESYTEKLRRILVGDDPVKVINAMYLSAQIEPLEYERNLQRMLANPNPEIQLYVLQCIESEALLSLLPELKALKPVSEECELKLSQIIDEFEKKEEIIKSGLDLESLVTSRRVKDRVFAAEVIGARKDKTYTSSLVNLTREFEPDVKIAAVKAMARMSNPDHGYLLMEFLYSPDYHAYAFEALIEIGDPAIEYLERLFLNPNTDDKILARVVRIYGKIGTSKAIDLLLSKLENQSRVVSDAAISALHEANFQASSLNVHRILNIIVRTIHVIGWNYLVYTNLPKQKKFFTLRMAFSREIEMNYDLLYNLLSLAYNAKTLREIRGLLDKGDAADVSHAIEMLDHFVYEDIKQVLFPVIENIKPEERVKRLQYYFPLEVMTLEEMISFTLTRDYNLLSLYPRVCAMQLAMEIDEFSVTEEMVANLFHPNKLLREVAAMVTHTKDRQTFNEVITRLNADAQHELADTIMTLEHSDQLLLIEKFSILKRIPRLTLLPENVLIEIAESLEENHFSAGQTINLSNEKNNFAFFIVKQGDIAIHEMVNTQDQNQEYELLYSRVLVEAGVKEFTVQNDTIIFSVNTDRINTLIFDYTEVANCVLGCVEHFKLAV